MRSKHNKLWNTALVAAAICTGVALSWKTWQVYFNQSDKANSAIADAQRAELDRADLVRKQALAESSLGREAAARNKGFIRPGEKALANNP